MTALGRLAAAAVVLICAPARAQMDDDAHDRHAAELARMRERAEAGRRHPSRSDGPPRHEGFYFRADSGYGYMIVTLPVGTEVSYSGPAAIAAFHVGGTVQDRALLGVQVWAANLDKPKVKAAEGSWKLTGASLGNLGVGPELTVYFMPANAYVSSAVGLTWLTLSSDGSSRTSRRGLGGRVAVGTEWWVTREWGFGVAAALSFTANRFDVSDFGGSLPFQAWNLGAVLSATYN